jgi:hypothetical protein
MEIPFVRVALVLAFFTGSALMTAIVKGVFAFWARYMRLFLKKF